MERSIWCLHGNQSRSNQCVREALQIRVPVREPEELNPCRKEQIDRYIKNRSPLNWFRTLAGASMHAKFLTGLVRGLFAALIFSFMTLAQANETGLLWKVEAPSGATSFLFGTMHSDDPRVTDFSPQVMKSLLDSDVFIMETLPPSNPAIYLMENGRLDHMLNEQEFVQV